jgi:hypothetical protein
MVPEEQRVQAGNAEYQRKPEEVPFLPQPVDLYVVKQFHRIFLKLLAFSFWPFALSPGLFAKGLLLCFKLLSPSPSTLRLPNLELKLRANG